MLHRANKKGLRSPFLPLLVLLSVSPLQARPVPSFLVSGQVEAPHKWTAGSLRRAFSTKERLIHFRLKSQDGSAHAIPLLSVAMTARPRLNHTRKHPELSLVVVVEGRDGYTVSFSMGELRLASRSSSVWLATDWNSAPLKANEAPARLLVQNDYKPSRWVHGIARIVVVDAGQLVPILPQRHHHRRRA